MKSPVRFPVAVAISMGMAAVCGMAACGRNPGASADAAPAQGDDGASPSGGDAVPEVAPAEVGADTVIAPVDTSPVDGDVGLEPIRVVGGGAGDSGYHDFVVVGQEFTGLDGKIVTIRTGRPGTMERLGSGQVRVEQGGFTLRLPAALENGLYKQKVVQVDADGDRVCGAGDLLFEDSSANERVGLTEYVMMVSPTSPNRVAAGDFPRYCDDVRKWP